MTDEEKQSKEIEELEKIEEIEQWELYNMKIPKLNTLDERLGAKIGIKYVLQSLLEKKFPVTITKEELEKELEDIELKNINKDEISKTSFYFIDRLKCKIEVLQSLLEKED